MQTPLFITAITSAAKKALNLVPPVPAAILTREKFIEITYGYVIPNFEGGYYHPSMKLHMSVSDQHKMGSSGETMFGLDRQQGGQLAIYPEWNQFWAIIYKAGAATSWKQYYMGGQYQPELKELCAKIMYQWFNHLAAMHLKGDSISKIAGDDRLIIHMSYACWNGEGWFKRYARAINVAAGTKDEIFNTAIKARTLAMNVNKLGIPTSPNVVIRQQGVKMMALFKTLKLVA
jgi:hypothetical protein